MATLGDLERSIMDQLWGTHAPMSAYDIQDGLDGRELAATTILTVLARLEKKGFVRRKRDARPHTYIAIGTREDHMAELMHEVLGSSTNRTAVLERFVGQVSAEEAKTLRSLLGG